MAAGEEVATADGPIERKTHFDAGTGHYRQTAVPDLVVVGPGPSLR
jgi:hypothetical protein